MPDALLKSRLTSLPEWAALQAHAAIMAETHLRDLFAKDALRFESLSFREGSLLIDLSKQRVTSETLRLLLDLARARDLEGVRAAMFAGEKINLTENRAALHLALRHRGKTPIMVDGIDVMPEVRATLHRLQKFTDQVRSGAWTGATGKTIRHIVNIGIGGSHLGPMFVADALKDSQRWDLTVDFVSNADRAQIDEVLKNRDPAATLFVVASKTFSTVETMSNARIARHWIASAMGDAAIAKHFAAVSTNLSATGAFGVSPEGVFPIWDWVGGRYSVWSAIGLAVMLACGFDVFERLLAGADMLDRHFANAPLHHNLPVLMGLIGLWNIDFLGCDALAVLPYDHRLKLMPAHLQQLDMESNGKSVPRGGGVIGVPTGPIVFGGGGSDSQHSFFQLLHQGPRIVPCDFIIAMQGASGADPSRDLLMANALAQTEALMSGRQVAHPDMLHRAFSGNRPTTTILLDAVTPESVGALIALYEHKVFVQGAIWGINSFDQFGVELGKELATTLMPAMEGGALPADKDSSTAGLVAAYMAAKGKN